MRSLGWDPRINSVLTGRARDGAHLLSTTGGPGQKAASSSQIGPTAGADQSLRTLRQPPLFSHLACGAPLWQPRGPRRGGVHDGHLCVFRLSDI